MALSPSHTDEEDDPMEEEDSLSTGGGRCSVALCGSDQRKAEVTVRRDSLESVVVPYSRWVDWKFKMAIVLAFLLLFNP